MWKSAFRSPCHLQDIKISLQPFNPCIFTLSFIMLKNFLALLFAIACVLIYGNASAQTGLTFNGTNSYVAMGAAPGLNCTSFTVEAWFKKEGVGVSTSTGTGGLFAIPLVAKGRAEAE